MASDISQRYAGIQRVAIHHRLGLVPVMEASVVISVSAVHRKEAIHAVEDLINQLKKETAIWKKEIYENGDATWKANVEAIGS